ncbi:NACHT and WD repeat domain-containing protein [Catenuloplanes japonicus]|uniref:NACHT and WD repeat domain-containing protein n=1 Tax=Catenuloplanes japonicus TaxID=33876 RepID=UPI0012FA0527|nr:WD40 repeat domain-containing protein [Catenuloplanes japonicus]
MANHKMVHGTIEGWFKGRIVRMRNEPAFRIVLRELGVTGQADQDAWVAGARKLRTRRAPSAGVEPFRGLESYNVTDAEMYYGRGRLIEQVLEELAALYGLGGGAMLLTGVSGAGKSSLLKAGVIPALAGGRHTGSASWPVLFVSAGPNAVDRLAEAVAARLRVDADKIAIDLRGGPASVAGVVQRLVASSTKPTSYDKDASGSTTDAKVVLIVDQFEQAMISTADGAGGDDALESFIAVLQAMTSGPVRVAVIFGVRLDFLNAAMLRRSLRDLTKGRPPVVVGPMDDNDLIEVIDKPAQRVGVRPEPGFVELLLRDISARDGRVAHQAGTLPLLSHALRMTWERGNGQQMTLANYRAVGGIDGALSESAEKVYTGLSPKQQTIARRMFFCLVHLHPSGADTRRQISQDELFTEIDGGAAELDVVLDRFVAQRLLTIDEDTVEITHDALMVAWPQLRDWLNADRDDQLRAQKLNTDARAWDHAGRPTSDYYRGTRLQAAQEWRERHPAESNKLSREFLDAATRYARRSTRALQLTVGVLTILLLVAGMLTGVVFQQFQNAERQRDEAQSRSLASQVRTLRGKDVALARQLALTAFQISPTTEARSALIDATALRPAVRMRGGVGTMYAVGIHPSGTIAAIAAENTIRFWDITNPGHPKPQSDPPAATCSKIYALAFSSNGNLLAASCGDGTIHLWNTRDPMAPAVLPTLSGLGAKVYSVAFSPDASMMAAAVAEPPVGNVVQGSVRLWRVSGDTPKPLGEPVRVDDNAPAKSVAFHPSNKHLAVGTDDGTVHIWDISTAGQPANPVPAVGAARAIGQLAFSPDGTTLAAGGADNLVYLWSTIDPRSPRPDGPPIGGSATYINAVAFSPDGATLAIASSDANNGVRLLDLVSRHIVATMAHPTAVTAVKFSPDSTQVITGANDGTARIWPVLSSALESMDYTVSAARFSPNGDTLAIGSADLRLLDVSDPQYPRPLGPAIPNPDGFSGTLAFAPNNRLLAEGRGRSGTAQIWNIANPSQLIPLGQPLKAHSKQIETLAFSPDSTILATGSRDGAVHLWDVRTPETPVRLSTPGNFGGFVHEVAFSPDGTLLVAGSADKTIRLWDISSPRTPIPVGPPLTPANHYVYSTVFSPDGTMLAVSLADSTIRLFDVTEPGLPTPLGAPLAGPEGYVHAVSFASDGSTLAATAGDGTVSIWNLRDQGTPTLHASLTLGAGAMFPVNYQPHTHLLVAGGDQKKAWIWTTDTDAAAALICDTSGDPITPEEWEKHIPARAYDPPCL